jgi:hypothetical protein
LGYIYFFYNHHPSIGENHLIIFHRRVQMKKRTQLKTALLLAALVNVSYAAKVCFPPAERTPFSDVLQCMQDELDAQQQRIATLEKENQRLTRLVHSSQRQIDTQQQQIAALETENQRLARLVEAQRQKKKQLQQKVAQMNSEIAQLKHRTIRYIDNGDGTVTDKDSGLTWLKNANCFGNQNWRTAKQSAAGLKSGQCGLRDGSTAGMWRLPTRDELLRMVDKRYKIPALSNAAGTAQWKEGDPFSGVQIYFYWSSTPHADYSDGAWYVSLSDGGVNAGGKTFAFCVWPVRRRQ